MRSTGTELLVVARKSVKADGAKGQHRSAARPRANRKGRSSPSSAKPFEITKREVWKAYQQVRANRGAAGVDGQSLKEFEEKLADNLYQLWNRMSSGAYFPPPVREVLIPKADEGQRALGVPTVADRIAQTVVKQKLEPLVEPQFDQDSYGYRLGKSAHDAIARAQERCRTCDWSIDLDVKAFFDSLDHDLVMHAVRWFTSERWVLLYIRRWLDAPILGTDGALRARTKGSPQGGVISPLLANIFMHFAFDKWFRRTLPGSHFERYADDIVVHCKTQRSAVEALRKIRDRLAECRLDLHPEKTKIVYCRDARRTKRTVAPGAFDFLSFTFRQRTLKIHGRLTMRFEPAASKKALKRVRLTMRRWAVHRRTRSSLDELAAKLNPVIRGWINYYGAFGRSELNYTFMLFNSALANWAKNKFKRMKRSWKRAYFWLCGVARREPNLFAHWELLKIRPTAER